MGSPSNTLYTTMDSPPSTPLCTNGQPSKYALYANGQLSEYAFTITDSPPVHTHKMNADLDLSAVLNHTENYSSPLPLSVGRSFEENVATFIKRTQEHKESTMNKLGQISCQGFGKVISQVYFKKMSVL